MTDAKNINLFLMDGNPTGRIKCSLANWTGLAYKIPRAMLDKAKDIDALNQTGVYLLFGTLVETDEPLVYVGQAGIRKNGQGILRRWEEHNKSEDKEWWNEAVALTTRDDYFGPTEISYLENKLRNMALEAKRYKVMNSNEPTAGNITEEKQSELDDFIESARLVIGALGYKLLEPIVKKPENLHSQKQLIDDEPILFFQRQGADARGQITSEGFAVLAGSRISTTIHQSARQGTRNLRRKYRHLINADGVLTQDLLFTSPSAAASFVGGGTLSGNATWKTNEGIFLGQLLI